MRRGASRRLARIEPAQRPRDGCSVGAFAEACSVNLRTRTRPGEFDPLDWVLEHWQAQDRPDAEHFIALSALFRTYQAVTARTDEILKRFELTRTGYLLLTTLFLTRDNSRALGY